MVLFSWRGGSHSPDVSELEDGLCNTSIWDHSGHRSREIPHLQQQNWTWTRAHQWRGLTTKIQRHVPLFDLPPNFILFLKWGFIDTFHQSGAAHSFSATDPAWPAVK